MTIGFVSPVYTVSEVDFSITVQMRLLGSTEIPLTLFLSTSDQTAVAGQDYVGVMELPVVFGPYSVSSVSTDIQLIEDGTVETEERFQLLLEMSENLTRVVVDQNMVTINIQDSDCKLFTACVSRTGEEFDIMSFSLC